MEKLHKLFIRLCLVILPAMNCIQSEQPFGYIGCYKQDTFGKDSIEMLTRYNNGTYCINVCMLNGHRYAGTQVQNCRCGKKLWTDSQQSTCNIKCPCQRNELCGGENSMSIYDISLIQDTEDSSSVSTNSASTTSVSTTSLPATSVSTTPVPATPVSTTSVPTTSVSTTPVSTTSVPATSVSTTPVPATSVSTTSVPTTSVSTTPVSTTSVPATSVSTTSVPTTSVSTTPVSTTSVPATSVSTTSVPTTSVSTTPVSTTSVPATSVSTTPVSTTAMSTTSLPTTALSATLVSTISVPTISVPTTLVSTTSPPTISVPTTSVPTTSLPTTLVSTTSAPTISVPPTSVPTTSLSINSLPTSEVPTHFSQHAGEMTDDLVSVYVSVPIVVVVVVAIVLVVMIFLKRKRRRNGEQCTCLRRKKVENYRFQATTNKTYNINSLNDDDSCFRYSPENVQNSSTNIYAEIKFGSTQSIETSENAKTGQSTFSFGVPKGRDEAGASDDIGIYDTLQTSAKANTIKISDFSKSVYDHVIVGHRNNQITGINEYSHIGEVQINSVQQTHYKIKDNQNQRDNGSDLSSADCGDPDDRSDKNSADCGDQDNQSYHDYVILEPEGHFIVK